MSVTAAFAPARHRFAVFTAASTLALIFAGGLVTSTGSGLSVPDWPLSYGQVMPPMVGGVFYEHGHRMVASAVGLLTLVLAAWTARREPRAGVRRLAWAALAAVIVQGLLGGLTVLLLLPTAISVTHAMLAQAFFCSTIAIAYATSREWLGGGRPAPGALALRRAGLLLTAAAFVQLALGALMRHTGAGLAIPDFPLTFGRVLPPVWSAGVLVHFAHRVGALCVVLAAVHACRRASATADMRMVLHAGAVFALLTLQVAIGAIAVLSAKAPLPTTAHVAVGAAILGSAFLLTLRAYRVLVPADEDAPAQAAA